MVFKMRQLVLFGALKSAHTFEHLVPVHLETVKLGTVDTHEFGLATYGQTAGTTHAGAIYHDGVQ